MSALSCPTLGAAIAWFGLRLIAPKVGVNNLAHATAIFVENTQKIICLILHTRHGIMNKLQKKMQCVKKHRQQWLETS